MRDTSMQKVPRCGTLVEWNDARGFGWLRPDAGGDRVFVHISALQPKPTPEQRPQVGWKLEYQLEVQEGKLRAKNACWQPQQPAAGRAGAAQATPTARPKSATPPRKPRNHSVPAALLGFLGALVVAVPVAVWFFTGRGDAALWYAGASVLAFAMYWIDKSAAQRGQWRVPEARLHLLSLAGGWPGALLAQHALRHKNQKRSFQIAFAISVLLNGIALWAWLERITF